MAHKRPLARARTELPFCERCIRTAVAKETRYGERCFCPGCGRWSWGRKPLADAATHAARRAAHAAFDPLWKTGLLSRGRAYAMLQQALGLTPDECHMAEMDQLTANQVPSAVFEILSRLDPDMVTFGNDCRPIPALRITQPTRPTW